ncbi:MAG: hypothetical protein K6B28_08675 [Lachnospiraceae bacterium]|nr:hypothetical protein [Lachnospiraceae bacterium]
MQEGYVILRKIINKRGIKILKDRKVLSSLIEDLIPTNIREKTSLQLAVGAGVAELFADIDKKDKNAARAKIETIKKYISDDIGLNEQRTLYIVNAFMYGIGMEAVSVNPNESGNYKELAEKYEKEGHNELAKLLYDVVSDVGNDEVKYHTGMSLLHSDLPDARVRGVEILKTLTSRKDAMYAVGMEYLEGKTVVRNFDSAYKYIASSLPYPRGLLEMGKLHFYGWGVKADINKAIKLLEQYIKVSSKGKDGETENTDALINAGPCLTECYYEDILLRKSLRSLDKLTYLADYKGFRMAQKYLFSYYSDKDSDHYNEFMSAKYKKKLEKNRENPCLKLNSMRGNMNSLMMSLKVTGALYMHSMEQFEDCAIALKDHLLLGEELNENGLEDNAALSYLLMAEMLFSTEAMENNILRAEIYLKNYLDRVSQIKDKKNYSKALVIYSRLLFEHKLSTPKWKSADECIELAEKLTGESVREEIMEDMLKKVRYFGHKGEMLKAAGYLEKAVEYGYHGDYSIIGMVYLNGEDGIDKDEEKGFYWLKKFYDEYMMERLTLTEQIDIGSIEFMLGKCYKNGTGVKESKDDAIVYFERASDHGSKEAKEIIDLLA